MRVVFIAAAAFGVACAVSAVMPTFTAFAISLVLVGFASITLMTTVNSLVQTTTEPMMRGRVMALYMAIFVGGTPLGALHYPREVGVGDVGHQQGDRPGPAGLQRLGGGVGAVAQLRGQREDVLTRVRVHPLRPGERPGHGRGGHPRAGGDVHDRGAEMGALAGHPTILRVGRDLGNEWQTIAM